MTLAAGLQGSSIVPIEQMRKLRPTVLKEVIKVTGLAEGRQDLNPSLCDSGLFPQPWLMSQVQDPANDIGWC